jgi:dTMP kinase
MTNKGKFIVIEGTDGSGKTTQLKLLANFLKAKSVSHQILDFPQYDSFWGKIIGKFLRGEFGELDEVSPYLIQPFYMLDQASKASDIEKWKSTGDIILANRYITSSMAHQTSKLPKGERETFLKWMTEAGYNRLKVAKEDLVIVLYIPVKTSMELAQNKNSKARKSYALLGREIAEEDYAHQKKSGDMYLELSRKYSHWRLINCINEKEELKSIEEIHDEIVKVLADEGIV